MRFQVSSADSCSQNIISSIPADVVPDYIRYVSTGLQEECRKFVSRISMTLGISFSESLMDKIYARRFIILVEGNVRA